MARGIARLSDPALFRRWIYTIVTRTALHHRTARRREQPMDPGTLDEREAPREDADPRVEAVARLRRGLNRLSGEQRALLSLHHLEGFELAALAEILRIPEGTVKSRLHHARAALRAQLERTRP
jgi:RNA polymerase sigma-70 factor (ECF subfamily)